MHGSAEPRLSRAPTIAGPIGHGASRSVDEHAPRNALPNTALSPFSPLSRWATLCYDHTHRQESVAIPSHPTPTSPVTPDSDRSRIAVLLVDDHPAVRVGARNLIDDQPDMHVVAEARSAEDALERADIEVDVAVIDYHLGNGRDGLWLTAALKRLERRPPVLVYTAFADNALAVMAVIAGADGLLDKRELGPELCSAIRRLARGKQHLPAIRPSLAQALRSRLTPRDQAIFGMLVHATPPDLIVERLGITHDELRIRRSIILASLRRARRTAARRSKVNGPLDYERQRRHLRWPTG